jgi:hypothetical protein
VNIETISMDPKAAALAFKDYRTAVKLATDDRRRREDEQVMRAYKAASKGLQVLDLHEVMKATGLNAQFYPKLAICRAHMERCRVWMGSEGTAIFHDPERQAHLRSRNRTILPADTFGRWTYSDRPHRWQTTAVAMVPTIPPALRPKHALSGYFILWEAVWQPAPPVDPLLLKHLGGALYAVLAAWDLSAIERAVLRGRLTTS